MKKLGLVSALALGLVVAGCGSDTTTDSNKNNNNTGDQCFSGTPTTNLQIVTSCAPQTVVTVALSPTIKHRKADGSLPTPPEQLPN